MTEQSASISPVLFLSSADAGWEGLTVQAYHEPREFEGWITPTDKSAISLILFTGGTLHIDQRYVNGPWKALRLHQGDLSLQTNAATPYEMHWKSLTAKPTQTLHIHLSRELISRTAAEVGDLDPARLTVVRRVCFQDPLLLQIGLALRWEIEQSAPPGKLYAQTAAQMLAVHLLRHYTSAPIVLRERSQGLTSHQVKQVADFIQFHLDQDLSLEMLAEHIGFSSYYFARLFRQTVGESPHQFVLHQRIERAQGLLKETRLPLIQIAEACGFTDQSHLTQIFKRHLGLTPRAYRQSCARF
jgi:AraC family transcriptional regulator